MDCLPYLNKIKSEGRKRNENKLINERIKLQEMLGKYWYLYDVVWTLKPKLPSPAVDEKKYTDGG